MRKPVTDIQEGFAGGLNVTADVSQLAPNEMRRAENGRLTTFGAFTKRLGTQRTHAAAIGGGSAIRGGFAWRQPGSVTQLAIANGTLHTGTYAIPMVWTAQVGALDASAYPSFAPFRDATQEVCYIADGGLLNKWNGTAFTVNIASTPNIARIALQNQRLFGISGVDQTLYYSPLNNGDGLGTGVTDSGSAVIRTFGNQELKALLALGDSLVLFHREGISRFTGYTSEDISLATGTRGISSDAGTIAPDSVVAVENTGYFLTDRGVYRVTEAGVAPVSQKIESVVSALDQTQFNRVKSAHHRAYREIWFYFPDVGCYVYNYRLDAWSGPMTGLFTDFVPYALWQSTDATGLPIVLVGMSDGFVRRVDSPGLFKDDYLSTGAGGTAFTSICQLRRMYFGAPEEEKAFRRAEIQVDLKGSVTYGFQYSNGTQSGSKTLTVTPGTVWGGSGTVWGTSTWGSGGTGSQEVQIGGRGNYLDTTLSDDGTAAPVTSRVAVQAISYGRRYGAL